MKKNINTKSRRWFFTLHNWPDKFEDKNEVAAFFENIPGIAGYVIGFEIGKESGTPHLQGVLRFSTTKRFSTLIKQVPGAHFEHVRDLTDAVNYCKKDGDFIEFGDMQDKQGTRNDIYDFRDAILEGATSYELLMDFPQQFFRFNNEIGKAREVIASEIYSKQMRTEIKVIYLAGVPGSGKTRFLYDNFSPEQIYRVTDYDNPFDMYQYEPVLVLDEFHGQLKINEILNILDIYPLQLRARYSNKWAAFKVVFIISNKPLMHQYSQIKEYSPETHAAFLRRIHWAGWLEDTDDSREQIYKEIKELLELEN